MTRHGGFGGFRQLQGLEQSELFRNGSADAGVGVVSDGGAVLLDAPELQCRRAPAPNIAKLYRSGHRNSRLAA